MAEKPFDVGLVAAGPGAREQDVGAQALAQLAQRPADEDLAVVDHDRLRQDRGQVEQRLALGHVMGFEHDALGNAQVGEPGILGERRPRGVGTHRVNDIEDQGGDVHRPGFKRHQACGHDGARIQVHGDDHAQPQLLAVDLAPGQQVEGRDVDQDVLAGPDARDLAEGALLSAAGVAAPPLGRVGEFRGVAVDQPDEGGLTGQCQLSVSHGFKLARHQVPQAQVGEVAVLLATLGHPQDGLTDLQLGRSQASGHPHGVAVDQACRVVSSVGVVLQPAVDLAVGDPQLGGLGLNPFGPLSPVVGRAGFTGKSGIRLAHAVAGEDLAQVLLALEGGRLDLRGEPVPERLHGRQLLRVHALEPEARIRHQVTGGDQILSAALISQAHLSGGLKADHQRGRALILDGHSRREAGHAASPGRSARESRVLCESGCVRSRRTRCTQIRW